MLPPRRLDNTDIVRCEHSFRPDGTIFRTSPRAFSPSGASARAGDVAQSGLFIAGRVFICSSGGIVIRESSSLIRCNAMPRRGGGSDSAGRTETRNGEIIYGYAEIVASLSAKRLCYSRRVALVLKIRTNDINRFCQDGRSNSRRTFDESIFWRESRVRISCRRSKARRPARS